MGRIALGVAVLMLLLAGCGLEPLSPPEPPTPEMFTRGGLEPDIVMRGDPYPIGTATATVTATATLAPYPDPDVTPSATLSPTLNPAQQTATAGGATLTPTNTPPPTATPTVTPTLAPTATPPSWLSRDPTFTPAASPVVAFTSEPVPAAGDAAYVGVVTTTAVAALEVTLPQPPALIGTVANTAGVPYRAGVDYVLTAGGIRVLSSGGIPIGSTLAITYAGLFDQPCLACVPVKNGIPITNTALLLLELVPHTYLPIVVGGS